MSNFELGIINAVKAHFGDDVVSLCFFHICQIFYRKIQEFYLQTQYQDEDDTSIRETARSLGASAFVPSEDVLRVFDAFYDCIPDAFIPVADYFETTYIRGIPTRGRKRAVSSPKLWNMHDAVLQGKSRTNNASEGWHNRFQTLVDKSSYSFLTELQK